MLNIIIIFHNFIIQSLLYYSEMDDFESLFASIVVSILYILEFLYILKVIRDKRSSYAFDTFKKIGADPEVNKAYNIRLLVNYLSHLDIFLNILVAARFSLPPIIPFRSSNIIVIVIFVLTLLDEIFIHTQSILEYKTQRKIAIGILSIKFICDIVKLILDILENDLFCAIRYIVKIIINIDILIVSGFLAIYLIKDFKNYGSGLKENLKFTTKKIELN